jgi:hypothetical protein
MLHFRALTRSDEEAVALFAETRPTWDRYAQYLNVCLESEQSKRERPPLRWKYTSAGCALSLKPKESLLAMPESAIVIEGLTSNSNLPTKKTLFRTKADGTAEKVTISQVVADENSCMLETHPTLQPGDTLDWGELEGLKVVKSEAKIRKDQLTDENGAELRLKRIIRKNGQLLWVLDRPTPPAKIYAGKAKILFKVTDLFTYLREARVEIVDEAGQSYKLETEGDIVTGDSEPSGKKLQTADELFSFDFTRLGDLEPEDGGDRRSKCVTLMLDDHAEDGTIDPRDIFMEESGEEIIFIEQVRKGQGFDYEEHKARITHKHEGTYNLEVSGKLPSPRHSRIIPSDRSADYKKQYRAIFQLYHRPLVTQGPLLRLGSPANAGWPKVTIVPEPIWFHWPADKRDSKGTERQKDFVRKALSTPDFCLLEGPPGSGKTHAICELIEQILKRPPDGKRKRILVCGSTYASIDNVIDRLKSDPEISLLKVNKDGGRHDELRLPFLNQGIRYSLGLGESKEAKALADEIVAESADVTCTTVMGATRHPWFRFSPNPNEPMTMNPPWDYLIIDESSKTLVQEFLVPAVLAKRWIIVGDVKQLAPYVDDNALTTNLRHQFKPPELQVALNFCLELIGLRASIKQQADARPLLARHSHKVNRLIIGELRARGALEETVWVGKPERDPPRMAQLRFIPHGVFLDESSAAAGRLLMSNARLILVDDDAGIASLTQLPGNCLDLNGKPATDKDESTQHQMRQRKLLNKLWPSTESPVESFAKTQFRGLARELSWRLARIHALEKGKSVGLNQQVYARLPQHDRTSFQSKILMVSDTALPSILECLQRGVPTLVGLSRNQEALLTTGFSSEDLQPRMATLDHQHRMHPFISELPRKLFYAGRALHDSDTVTEPSRQTRWGFKLKSPGAKRRHWINISGPDGRPLKSDEQVREEIDVTIKILSHFKDWAANNPPPPNRDGVPEPWEVACLSFYVKPYNLLKDALQSTFGPAKKGLFLATNMQINVATVDRFQGHEADMVILMMRRNGAKRSEGFLDIPNRVNVAITRAREQLVIVGDKHFFLDDGRTEHLRELAQNS